jgi:hypothetical protein
VSGEGGMAGDDLEARLRAVTRERQPREAKASADRYARDSKAQLLAVCKRKCQTGFIGALSRVEQLLGDLWGHGRPAAECSPDQLAWRPVWEELRTAILTNGNNQVRALENELALYTVTWDRYQTNLPVARPPA